MKQNSKIFLFTNFNLPIKPNTYEKNDLTINNFFNTKTTNSKIEPLMNFSNYFEKTLTRENYQQFQTINGDIVNQIYYVITYEYYQDSNQDTQLRKFILTTNFELYELDSQSMKLIDLNITFAALPIVFYDNEQLIVSDSKNTYIVIDKNNPPYFVTSYPEIDQWCTYLDNSYVLFKNKKYSIFSCTNSSIFEMSPIMADYEEIKLNPEFGAVENILEFDNSLLIFQQYKISKLTRTNLTHKVISTNYLTSKIYKNTIEKINDYVVFLTSSGLYIFDGNDTKQIFSEITKDITPTNLKSATFNNKYYLKAEYFISGAKENVIFEFDIENNNCSIYKFDSQIDNLFVVKNANEYLLCSTTIKNDIATVVCLDTTKTNTLQKQILFNKLAFDNNNSKKIKSIKIFGAGDFFVSLSSENGECNFHVYNNLCVNNVGLFGQFFELMINSNQAFIVNAISFEVEVIED